LAKFLTTEGLSYRLAELIKNAKERLVLISPYLNVNKRLRDLLEDRDRQKLDIRIIWGKRELQPEESNWLEELRSVRQSFCKNLHAKCYMSEEEVIVTSMNLYEFSQVNNSEMGVYFTRSVDPELFRDAKDEVDRLIRTSEEIHVSVEKVKATEPVAQPREAASAGHCIRCNRDIPLNSKKPYCASDYERWAEYGNEDYEDRYCHGCGKKHPATMRKPLCRGCYSATS
jgi:phosphatidylserine/phosphatidylglycerophosphate/cardiolipin synthase-like enzyme